MSEFIRELLLVTGAWSENLIANNVMTKRIEEVVDKYCTVQLPEEHSVDDMLINPNWRDGYNAALSDVCRALEEQGFKVVLRREAA